MQKHSSTLEAIHLQVSEDCKPRGYETNVIGLADNPALFKTRWRFLFTLPVYTAGIKLVFL
jgi:hypothetical protein